MSIDFKKLFLESLGTIFGALIMAISISLFLLPNELSSGGFSGIATIFYYIFKVPVGVTIVALNFPLFIFSGFKIGKEFFFKSILGTISLSIFTDFLEKYGAVTNDKILASVYGGILTGVGTAIILSSHASTGGSDLLSIIIKRYKKNLEVSRMIVIIDGIIVLLNVIFLKKFEIGLYSAITIYIMGVMVDVIFEGIFFSKLMFIISDKSDLISKEIGTKINRGVTGLYGKGMYTNNEKLILICAVLRRDVSNVKSLVKNIDKNAFIIVTNSREVLGIGFKRNI